MSIYTLGVWRVPSTRSSLRIDLHPVPICSATGSRPAAGSMGFVTARVVHSEIDAECAGNVITRVGVVGLLVLSDIMAVDHRHAPSAL